MVRTTERLKEGLIHWAKIKMAGLYRHSFTPEHTTQHTPSDECSRPVAFAKTCASREHTTVALQTML